MSAIPRNVAPREVDGGVEKLTEHQKMLLHLIKNDPSISKKEMSETIGIRPSSIDKNIATLKGQTISSAGGSCKRWALGTYQETRLTILQARFKTCQQLSKIAYGIVKFK